MLPKLSSTELERSFEGDPQALRRYRIMAALLHEGRPATEVARTFEVSREMLRRLRRALETQGLDGLRKRRRGGGHQARRSPLAQAIEDVLREHPTAGSAQVVRLVRERLEATGHAAPRSTIYRLLRPYQEEPPSAAGASSSGDSAYELLRSALGMLPEDPPLALGQSRLASRLVPFESDALRRGMRLQDALRRAIERLRPDDETGPRLDGDWRSYLIIAGEYITGEERSALQESLALSASTYSRAKRAALGRVLAALPLILAEAPPPDPPLALTLPPDPPAAFDRTLELDIYQRLLQRRGLALLWGPAGQGKSALAAALAAQLQARGQTVVWHSVRAGDGDEGGLRLLTTLAAALALHESRDLWHALATSVSMSGNAESIAALLSRDLMGKRWTVIVDGGVELADALGTRVLDVLAAACWRGDIRLVLTGRSQPSWLESQGWPPLPPLDDEAAQTSFRTMLAALLPAPTSAARLAPDAEALDLQLLRAHAAGLLAVLAGAGKGLSPSQRVAALATLAPLERAIAGLREP
jgi:transposase